MVAPAGNGNSAFWNRLPAYLGACTAAASLIGFAAFQVEARIQSEFGKLESRIQALEVWRQEHDTFARDRSGSLGERISTLEAALRHQGNGRR